jgi:hypothetical protein
MAARLVRVLSIVVLGAGVAACSWGTVQRPPPHATPSANPGCTTSGKPITVDGALALGFGIPGFGGLVAVAGGCQSPACFAVAFGGLVAALPFALSVEYGRRHVGQCRELDLTWRALERAREESRERARFPGAGGLDQACRRDSLIGRCDPGLVCREGRCARAPTPPPAAPEKPPKAAPASAPASAPAAPAAPAAAP